MDRVAERCCGLDVHEASLTACVRVPGESDGPPRYEVEEFATTTQGALQLRDWLASFDEVELVGMEATGAYWKPVYYLREDDFELWLLNARHLNHVLKAGRPTSRMPSGSAGWWNTGWCAQASCHPRRFGSLGT
jgi:transposase